ncbi:MAG TPA: ribose-phosphate diphosphokinase, partial [Campylobacterales bacterium]|nr:ribose-phosphate diphosphokinase [Campylobacterales bacterium]
MTGYMLFSGTANKELANEVSKYLDQPLSLAKVTRFSDGEINIKIKESVRGKDVFIIQPTSAPANANLMELLIMVDALKRSSAKSITAVVPYYGYAR